MARKSGEVSKIRLEEGYRILKKIPRGCEVIALSEEGRSVSTRKLAAELERWLGEGRNIAFLVGGADGLSEECRQQANACWSLSALTFPHALVRVIMAEQLFRAWSIVANHPYHRD